MLRSFLRPCYNGTLPTPSTPSPLCVKSCALVFHSRRPYQNYTRHHTKFNTPQFHGTHLLRSTSTSASLPPGPTTLVDPARPSLFYHLLIPPNPVSAHVPVYAVSFLEQPPKNPQGAAVLGWLPAATNAQKDEDAGIGDFIENPKFISVLHEVIKKVIANGSDERLNAEALQRGEGWMHVNDDRTAPALGRISSPDDIIASIMVEDGRILPQTYSPMPTYRICTTDGLTTLPEQLHSRLLEELRRIDKDGSMR